MLLVVLAPDDQHVSSPPRPAGAPRIAPRGAPTVGPERAPCSARVHHSRAPLLIVEDAPEFA